MRDGFLISEGACVLVLEEYEAALQRNATIYAEISGFSCTSDAFHMTKPSADGESDAIRKALIEAGISPAQVDYVSAHGTSTIIGDRVEAEALSRVFKDHPKVPVSGLKSMTGHMLAASGPFELACVAMSIKEGVIPPTINLNEKDAGCKINVITQAMRAPIEIALSNSFGFGGVNAVIIIKKCK
jgi:3-oxoacyl-[acyl-carrier-protein] synthase II